MVSLFRTLQNSFSCPDKAPTLKMSQQQQSTVQDLSKIVHPASAAFLTDALHDHDFGKLDISFYRDQVISSKNIDIQDNEGETFLIYLMRFGSAGDVLFLLKLGADPSLILEIDDEEYETMNPLTEAVLSRKEENIQVFLEYCQHHHILLDPDVILLSRSKVANENPRILKYLNDYAEWAKVHRLEEEN